VTEDLAEQLIWKIGVDEQGTLIIRVGMASASARFALLPRLRNAADEEMAALVQEGKLQVEWVGGPL
jgi:hypothetical protein